MKVSNLKIFEQKFSIEELEEINNVLVNGNLGFGSNVEIFERSFEEYSNKKFNIAVNSASAAAYMIFYYLKQKFGVCDVYTTSLGFISPAWAAKETGHNIIYVDVDENLQFSCKDYYTKLQNNNRKKVLMPVLYSGVSIINNWNPMGDEIVVVDSAHCVTPKIKSNFTFFSFHPYKPICCSDGGMISTDEQEAAEYFNLFKNFGRKNLKNTYDIISDGFKFYMNNLNATIALVSMKKYHKNLFLRKKNFKFIDSQINKNIKIIEHDDDSSYYFGLSINKNANKIMEELNLVRMYPLIHKTTNMKKDTKLNNLENIHESIVNFPIHHNLNVENLEFIIDVFKRNS